MYTSPNLAKHRKDLSTYQNLIAGVAFGHCCSRSTFKVRAVGFKGIIVVVNYYSVDYSDVNETAITAALNQALASASAKEGAVVAEIFTAFQALAGAPGGQTCNVGLLNASPQEQFVCDIHPSQSVRR